MSQRLGKIQQAIITALEQSGGSASVTEIILRIFHPDRVNDDGEINYTRNYRVEDGQFVWENLYEHKENVTVDRAVRSLEQRGLVTTELHDPRSADNLYGGPRWKSVKMVRTDEK